MLLVRWLIETLEAIGACFVHGCDRGTVLGSGNWNGSLTMVWNTIRAHDRLEVNPDLQHSPLCCLKEFDIDYLKIDQSFIRPLF